VPGAGLCDCRVYEFDDPQRIDHPLPRAAGFEVGQLPGFGAGRVYPGGVLVHHSAAVCRHLEARRGLGPAITFLFVGPAINILAITYTGATIGFDIAIARLVLSIVFGIAIGLIMAWVFRKEETARAAEMAQNGLFDQTAKVKPAVWVLFLLLVAVLIVGTLQIPLLTNVYANLRLPFDLSSGLAECWSRSTSRCKARC
jgi:hypothetical protein